MKEIHSLVNSGEFDYLFTKPEFETALLYWKDEKDPAVMQSHVEKVIALLSPLPEKTWNGESVKSAIWDYATEVGRGLVLWPMRVALSGKEKSPDPFTLAQVLGKEETLSRLQIAQDKLL